MSRTPVQIALLLVRESLFQSTLVYIILRINFPLPVKLCALIHATRMLCPCDYLQA
jgi:hypothetical protein